MFMLIGDVMLLWWILLNFVINVVKVMCGGSVYFFVMCEVDNLDGYMVIFLVMDIGCGIVFEDIL